jgi:hypothetical protein
VAPLLLLYVVVVVCCCMLLYVACVRVHMYAYVCVCVCVLFFTIISLSLLNSPITMKRFLQLVLKTMYYQKMRFCFAFMFRYVAKRASL